MWIRWIWLTKNWVLGEGIVANGKTYLLESGGQGS